MVLKLIRRKSSNSGSRRSSGAIYRQVLKCSIDIDIKKQSKEKNHRKTMLRVRAAVVVAVAVVAVRFMGRS